MQIVYAHDWDQIERWVFCSVQAAFIGLWDVSADTLMRASLWASETWGMRSAAQPVYLVLYHISSPRWCRRRSLDREWLYSLTKVSLPLVILQHYEGTDLSVIFLRCCSSVWCVTSVPLLTKPSSLSISASCLFFSNFSGNSKHCLSSETYKIYSHKVISIRCIWKWCWGKEELRKSPLITFRHFEKTFPLQRYGVTRVYRVQEYMYTK